MKARKIFVIAFSCAAIAAWFAAIAAIATGLPTSVIVTVLPNAPANLTAAANSASTADLSWTDASNNETGFSMERSAGDDLHFSAVGSTAENVSVYHDTGLAADTLYYYRVDATGLGGNSLYSNEASTTTPSVPLPPPPSPPPSSGGGGGGGGGAPSVFQTSAIFRGIAYPESHVTLLENSQIAAVTQAGPDAQFEVDVTSIAPGTYTFGVWAQDPQGSRSIVQTFTITIANGATTVISGIFFAPTIGADKVQVKRGDVVTIFGYAAPSSTVTVLVHSPSTITQDIAPSGSGAWIYQLNTDVLDLGAHTAQAHAAQGAAVTPDSAAIAFMVGDTNVAAAAPQLTPLIGDLNGDGRVNLIDFSIMAYWFGRANPPAIVDLNHDGPVDLTDFSILAYYWTG